MLAYRRKKQKTIHEVKEINEITDQINYPTLSTYPDKNIFNKEIYSRNSRLDVKRVSKNEEHVWWIVILLTIWKAMKIFD